MTAALLQDLKREIATGQLLVIVGTGVSIAATKNSAAASWTGLLKSGVDRCEPRCPPGWGDRVRAQIDGDLVDLLCAAENVSQRLSAPNGADYASWLEETVGTLCVVDREVIEALVSLEVPLATTNYDDLLEDVSGLRKVIWTDRRRVESFVRGRLDGILHLHGHWDDPESVVLGIRSYEDILRDEHAQNTLRTLRTMRTLLFVGFGGGLQDPNFGSLLKWAGRVFSESGFRHYRLYLGATGPGALSSLEADQTISPLSYGAKYEDLGPFLRDLSAGRKTV